MITHSAGGSSLHLTTDTEGLKKGQFRLDHQVFILKKAEKVHSEGDVGLLCKKWILASAFLGNADFMQNSICAVMLEIHRRKINTISTVKKGSCSTVWA